MTKQIMAQNTCGIINIARVTIHSQSKCPDHNRTLPRAYQVDTVEGYFVTYPTRSRLLVVRICGNGSLYSRADFIYILVFLFLVFCHSVLYMVNQKPRQAASLDDSRISELCPPGVITTPGRQKRKTALNQSIYIYIYIIFLSLLYYCLSLSPKVCRGRFYFLDKIEHLLTYSLSAFFI